jgi:hypothetical protein
MNRRAITVALTGALVLASAAAGQTQAGGPDRTSDSYTDRFFDEFILELCGVETFTTVTERWTSKKFPDGSETFHVTRTFVPDDRRLPIEKGAATSFFAPDGTRRVVGKPLQLISQRGGGVLILDAGWVELDPFDSVLGMRGPHPSLDVDLSLYYCP